MIVAGIGSRKGVSAAEVMAAVDAALARHGCCRNGLGALATAATKRDEPGIAEAARALGLRLIVAGGEHQEALHSTSLVTRAPDAAARDACQPFEQAVRTLTRSAQSLAIAGTPSVSEAAALAAAGPGATLLGPRLVVGRVTCALATASGRRPHLEGSSETNTEGSAEPDPEPAA